MKLGILFGSSSNEHEVSILSATSIIENLNKDKYEVIPIYMDKDNKFYKWNKNVLEIKEFKLGEYPKDLELLENAFKYFRTLDCIFIMVHGKNGEDGILNSIFDFLNIPYVGNKMIPSIITMNKVLTKNELEKNNIKTAPYLSFLVYNNEYIMNGISLDIEELIKKIEEDLNYPIFIKPACSGSSIGITKALNKEELLDGINKAIKIDHHILLEEMVHGRELECAILEQNGTIITSRLGEVNVENNFYDFSEKYESQCCNTKIPAIIDKDIETKIREIAKTAFKALNLHIYSRIDFFLTSDNEIIINEINTIPGFTKISMYPKLLENIGYSYKEILDILIEEAIK